MADWQGVAAMQAIVYAALTSTPRHRELASKCNSSLSSTCNPWMGASLALNLPSYGVDDSVGNLVLQQPLIRPEQMTVAMYKLFGVAAATMMGQGPGNWTSERGLYRLDPANDLVTGRVPYQIVEVTLVVWAVSTVLPQVWAFLFWGRRWAATLDGFVLFRLGAEWKDVVHKLSSDNLADSGTDCLMHVPGLVGDMQKDGSREDRTELHGGGYRLRAGLDNSIGFVGLSDETATTKKGKLYSWN
ncbi:hypothetical protein PG984_016581 [Apiospora sp. TS-2023a]